MAYFVKKSTIRRLCSDPEILKVNLGVIFSPDLSESIL